MTLHRVYCIKINFSLPVSVFQCRMVCKDVSADTVYDVLHDTEYRRKWDTNVIETFDIGRLTVNADVGYYSCMCHTCFNLHILRSYIILLINFTQSSQIQLQYIQNIYHKVPQVSFPKNRLLLYRHLQILKTSLCQHLPCLLYTRLAQVWFCGKWKESSGLTVFWPYYENL